MKQNKPNIWGYHAVRAAWCNRDRHISHIFVTDNALKSFSEFQSVSGAKRPAPQKISKKELDKLTGGAAHQGLGLIAEPLEEVAVSDLVIAGSRLDASMIVMLDQVTDPHNVGAILRSACAFGAIGIIVQKKHAPAIDGVLAKTACGAVEHVSVAFETNLSRSIEALQQAGYMVYGLDERGDDIMSMRAHKPSKIVLVLGAEGPGLRPNVAGHCDKLLRLEMKGDMPSINVSNAAAVAMFALTQ